MYGSSIAIVIAAKNEEKYIEKCITSITEQNYPQELVKIIVCDGKSTDRTPDIVKAISGVSPNVELLINEREAAPFAFNLGIRHSNTNYLMILGAHAELKPNYLTDAISFLEAHPEISCLGGILDNVYENEASKAIGTAMSLPFGVGNAHFRTGAQEGFVDTVAFGIYKREIFEAIGVFDEELIRNQDDEFNYRLTKWGGKIYLLPALQSRYFVRASFKKLFRQYYQYGYWKVFVNKKHKIVTSVRQLFPPMFVLFLVSLPVMLLLGTWFLYFYLAILCLYLLIASWFAAKSANSFKNFSNIFLSFLCLHVGYGAGYLVGLYDVLLLGKSPVQNAKMKTLTR
ncbi:Glycosyltransferase, GT2 family [Chitinophaga eiseniae]|uniref:Glycosyltransferase, GT2 family n=1 Tax=Chitinophaga eiseniae TaxID=634771 RepID=A0A1T4RX10_9BACT|nr:glycosyltransferase family 2 protein [Chitinophaga eiseniae]SKA20406.1 Glycosyltransferase, GT2 family [Chitinophaga eiseniae]